LAVLMGRIEQKLALTSPPGEGWGTL